MRYDMPASALEQDPFGEINGAASADRGFQQLDGLDEELINSERIDQGFFRNMVTKLGRAELSHARWSLIKDGREVNELKCCAFTDDER